jgi:hypothetical protein
MSKLKNDKKLNIILKFFRIKDFIVHNMKNFSMKKDNMFYNHPDYTKAIVDLVKNNERNEFVLEKIMEYLENSREKIIILLDRIDEMYILKEKLDNLLEIHCIKMETYVLRINYVDKFHKLKHNPDILITLNASILRSEYKFSSYGNIMFVSELKNIDQILNLTVFSYNNFPNASNISIIDICHNFKPFIGQIRNRVRYYKNIIPGNNCGNISIITLEH